MKAEALCSSSRKRKSDFSQKQQYSEISECDEQSEDATSTSSDEQHYDSDEATTALNQEKFQAPASKFRANSERAKNHSLFLCSCNPDFANVNCNYIQKGHVNHKSEISASFRAKDLVWEQRIENN